MRDERGPWYLLTGFVIGALLGLGYAWLAQPVQYTNISPDSLRADFKDHYRALIAAAYVANGDLVRAQGRLILLKDEDVFRTLAEQAQRTLAEGGDTQDAQALGLLAVAIGQAPPTLNPGSLTPAEALTTQPASTLAASTTAAATPGATLPSTPTSTPPAETLQNPASTPNDPLSPPASPTATITLLPTRAPTATPGLPFVLTNRAPVCQQAIGQPLIQVQVSDSAGQPIPGVEVIATWDGGEDHFYTGLKPERGLGYTDFSMAPGVTYGVHLAAGGETVSGLSAMECSGDDGERYLGSWLLEFVQP